jgi:moderate conductance mechanosensitive channel
MQYATSHAGLIVTAVAGLLVAAGLLWYALHRAERALAGRPELRDQRTALARLVSGLNRTALIAGLLLLAASASWFFALPDPVTRWAFVIVRFYAVVAIGLLVIRSSVAIVEALEAVARRQADSRGWLSHYEPLRPLLPTLRTCLEYALWIGMISLALLQLGWYTPAGWGPPIMQAIGLFFLGRVVIELARVEVDRRLLGAEGLDEMTRRRRETIAPLIRSTLTYMVYFGTAVLILASLGFNPMPFLAGAGILGLVIGFGAQSLINDVVSGFFILFENTYLVGDAVEAAGAKGVVEAIEFRTTKIRDRDGRLHIVRNGDVKQVINYSKDYTLAVVPVDVTYDADLRSVFSILQEAGRRLRSESADLLGDVEVDGVVAFGASSMTVRTSTRVKPGRHEAAAAALRLAIKEAFDHRATGAPRGGLVPPGLAVARRR